MNSDVFEQLSSIRPYDDIEASDKENAISWLQSGVEIYRNGGPATPPKHLVVYFVLIDKNSILLVNHIAAGLWLPPGGHVEPNESLHSSVIRECAEELNIKAKFLSYNPILITETETVGKTIKHTDVCFWYLIEGFSKQEMNYDMNEFTEVRWFDVDNLPIGNCNPNLNRLIKKLRYQGFI